MKFIKYLSIALLLSPFLNSMAMSPDQNPFNIPPGVRDICEKVFNSNNALALTATSMVYKDAFHAYKLGVIANIYTILSDNAFTKGDPFRVEKLAPIFGAEMKSLLLSSNHKELCGNIMTMLKANGYTMSHLSILPNSPNNNNNNNLACAPSSVLSYEITTNNSSVVVIKFNEFSWHVYDQIEPLIKQAKSADRNILFDLRNNPGGLVKVMNKLLGLFLEPSTIVALLVQKSLVQKYSVNPGTLYDSTSLVEHAVNSPSCEAYLLQTSPNGVNSNYQGKLAVLVGPGTCSAAENFAYALNLIENVPILGTQSPGRALLSLNRTAENGVVTFPVGEMLHCDGVNIEGVGLTPNFNTGELGFEECIRRWLE